jgi:hypothetical protein
VSFVEQVLKLRRDVIRMGKLKTEYKKSVPLMVDYLKAVNWLESCGIILPRNFYYGRKQ